VLDENGGPKLYQGGCINCKGMVTINSSSGAVSFNEDYYAIGHASRFIQPGASRIASTPFGFGSIENVAAINPDGSTVVIATNSSYGPLTFQIRSHGATMQYTLESDSVATYVWSPQ
jgi:glucosylceramidase